MKDTKSKLIMTFIALGLFTVSICAQTTISNEPATRYQTMQGWGVSLAWWANLAGGMPQASIDDMANRLAVQLNLNFYRFNIGGGDNPTCQWGDHMRKDGGKMPGYRSYYPDNRGWGIVNVGNDTRQIAVMNKIASLRSSYGDIITEMFSCSPPYFMTKTYCTAGEWNGGENVQPGFEDDFADYLASVTATLKTAYSNWNIKYIEPFNEPYSNWWKAGENQEGCKIGHNVQATILWRLWQSQQTYGIGNIGLIASDCNTVPEARTNVYDLWANHINEYNGLSVIACHTYGGTYTDKVALYTDVANTGKQVWQTETGPLSWTLPSDGQWWWRHYDMAYRLVEDMRNLKCAVWCDWQAMSNDDGWGLVQQTNWNENNPYQAATLKNTRSFYIRKQIANYVKVGYTQIANSYGNSMTFLKPDNKEVVVVIVNNSTSSKVFSVDLTKFQTVSSFKTYRTSGDDSSTENATEKTIASQTEKGVLSANIIAYTAPAWSVTTFVVTVPGLSGASNVNSVISELNNYLDNDNTLFSVYPNPTSDNLTINFNNVENPRVQIFDLNGRKVYESAQIFNKKLVLDIKGNFRVGMYTIKVTGKNSTQSQKLIIK